MSTIDINLDSDRSVEDQIHDQRDKIDGFVHGSALFSPAPYINKAVIDGNLADEIAAKFSGSWEPPVEWFESAKLGQTITLQVEVEVVSKKASLKNAGEDATVAGEAGLKVIDVYLPTPEELV